MNFQNLELTEKSKKSAQKTASLKWHAFREKVKKLKFLKFFWKISDFLMNFQNLELMKNTENQQAQKMENLHVFQENSCTFSKAKRKMDLKRK